MIGISVPPGARQRHFAQLAGIDILFLGAEVVPAGALLHSDLADPVVHARRLHDLRPFFDPQRQRLLDVDVLAGVERVDRGLRVPVVRRGDQHHIELLHLEQLAMIGERFRVGRFLLGLVDLFRPDIAERRDLDIGIGLEQRHVVPASLAGSDHAENYFVVGAKDARVRDCGVGGRAPDERPPRKIVFRHVRIITRRRHYLLCVRSSCSCFSRC